MLCSTRKKLVSRFEISGSSLKRLGGWVSCRHEFLGDLATWRVKRADADLESEYESATWQLIGGRSSSRKLCLHSVSLHSVLIFTISVCCNLRWILIPQFESRKNVKISLMQYQDSVLGPQCVRAVRAFRPVLENLKNIVLKLHGQLEGTNPKPPGWNPVNGQDNQNNQNDSGCGDYASDIVELSKPHEIRNFTGNAT